MCILENRHLNHVAHKDGNRFHGFLCHFAAASAAMAKRTAASERKNSIRLKAGEFPYGTYQTFHFENISKRRIKA